jgi:ketosteroid isomerase-like protein
MGQALETMQQWFAKPDPLWYADDIDWYVPGYPVARERYVGRAAVTDEFFPTMRTHFSVWKIEVSELIEAGDRVTAIGRYVGTTTAGKPVVIPFLHVWTVRDRKITSVIAAADTSVFVRALS